jgi:hypothetical protein
VSLLLHPLGGLGYQFYSGVGSSITEWLTTLVTLGAIGYGFWRHRRCVGVRADGRRCRRIGHADPEHGHPLCREHQDKLPSRHKHPHFRLPRLSRSGAMVLMLLVALSPVIVVALRK